MTSTHLVGTLELASKYRYGLTSRGAPMYLFRPYHEDRPDYIVGCSERDTSRNHLAIVEVPADATASVTGTQKPRANLLRLFGPVGDPIAERTALLQHYCPVSTKPLAESVPVPNTSDDDRRLEISAETGWTTLHVDPPGCRDIDDAIAWFPTERLWAIVIADVAAAVPAASAVAARAQAIGSTFYDLEGRVVRPMLPPEISEDAASLLPGKRRRGLALLFPDSDPTACRWSLCWITVEHSYTYESFAVSPYAWMAGGQDPHDWIASLMIRYNAAAADLLKSRSYGVLRVQPPTVATTTVDASNAVSAKADTWPSELRHLLNERATYQPADVTATDQGHAGLGLLAYAHASSPLRRFADLLNQRALKALILGTGARAHETPETAELLNQRTVANRRWTRDLTFLTHVTPGKVHIVDVTPVSETHVWVPLWNRLLRLRHTPTGGNPTQIAIFCDPTKRNWRMRVLTAPAST
jgi:exoribonuclease R